MRTNNKKRPNPGAVATTLAAGVFLSITSLAWPLSAAEPLYLGAGSPLATAQQLESATAGGLFDPNRAFPFQSRRMAQAAPHNLDAGDAEQLASPLYAP